MKTMNRLMLSLCVMIGMLGCDKTLHDSTSAPTLSFRARHFDGALDTDKERETYIMSDAMKAYFEQMASQKDEGGGGGGSFLQVGKYRGATLEKVTAKAGYRGFSIIWNFRVTDASGKEPNPVGSTIKVICKTADPGKKGTMAKINNQRIIRALFHLPDNAPESQIVELMSKLADVSQPGRGMCIDIDGYEVETESKAKIVAGSYAANPWSRDPAEIARRRAALELGSAVTNPAPA